MCRWDQRSSAVTPEEDVFYLVALLRTAVVDGGDGSGRLEHLADQNRRILDFCRDERIEVKQYLPHYSTREEWVDHFGDEKWDRFHRNKMEFDPKQMLSTGQRIFKPDFGSYPDTASSL